MRVVRYLITEIGFNQSLISLSNILKTHLPAKASTIRRCIQGNKL